MEIFTINCITQDQVEVYCQNDCTGKCYLAEAHSNNNSALEIVQQRPCYKIFSINHSFATDWKEIKILRREQCMIAGIIVMFLDVQWLTMMCIDTGAQVNVVSETKLCEIFQQKSICQQELQSMLIQLKTVDNSALHCRGQVALTIKIGRNQAQLEFFVIKSGNVMLLGMPGIEALNLVIDLPF